MRPLNGSSPSRSSQAPKIPVDAPLAAHSGMREAVRNGHLSRVLGGRVALREQKAALDAQLGTLVADHEQRRSLRNWRAAQATLAEIPMRRLWDVTTPAEQRALLPAVLSSILADKDGMCFQLRGMEVEFKTKWITPGPDEGDKQVAGPGIEPGTP